MCEHMPDRYGDLELGVPMQRGRCYFCKLPIVRTWLDGVNRFAAWRVEEFLIQEVLVP